MPPEPDVGTKLVKGSRFGRPGPLLYRVRPLLEALRFTRNGTVSYPSIATVRAFFLLARAAIGSDLVAKRVGKDVETMAVERRVQAVLVPGVITPAAISFRDLLPELGDEVDSVLKDLEVYSADLPPDSYELGLEADGIKRVADARGFDTFHLVGYSGGGAASLVFTARYPERVRSLALIEPALSESVR